MVQKEVADRLVARPGTKEYGVLTVMLSVHARGHAAARPAARRVHAAAEGALHASCGSSSARRRSGSRTSGSFEQLVKAHLQPAPEDARERAQGVRPDGAGGAGRGRDRRPAAAGDAASSTELARLAELFAAARAEPGLCYSFAAVFPPVFGSLPATRSGRTPAGRPCGAPAPRLSISREPAFALVDVSG